MAAAVAPRLTHVHTPRLPYVAVHACMLSFLLVSIAVASPHTHIFVEALHARVWCLRRHVNTCEQCGSRPSDTELTHRNTSHRLADFIRLLAANTSGRTIFFVSICVWNVRACPKHTLATSRHSVFCCACASCAIRFVPLHLNGQILYVTGRLSEIAQCGSSNASGENTKEVEHPKLFRKIKKLIFCLFSN